MAVRPGELDVSEGTVGALGRKAHPHDAEDDQATPHADDAALRGRDEFISVVAHDLKTPIVALRGYAQLATRYLDRGENLDRETLRSALAVVDQQSRKLVALIDQLQDAARLQNGTLPIEPRPCDLVALVQRVAAGAPAVDDRHTVCVRAPERCEVRADPIRLEQALVHLLDNALKYSPDGGEIEIDLIQPRPGSVCLAVRDHGIGVPPEHRERIFERYYQVQPGHGLGLGLHVSREIVRLHGGDVTAEFPEDGGTRIVACLPAP